MTFGGRYQLNSRIAVGGMGEVWRAVDLVIGREVALKILKDEYLGDPGFLERFRAEARHAALVNHEGIAGVYDYGEEEGSAYLVMEMVPGQPLSTLIEGVDALPTDQVLDIVAQTAAALAAAHKVGLVHRDVKPGNLLITPEGRVKITDFGIARIADQVPLTATGQVMGTVQYLSPEQASGHPASPATDIYSLGIVAYEALAGRRPFSGESQVAIAMAQINETPPELPLTISEPVRSLVMACIAKNPADRPASATDLSVAADALRRHDLATAIRAVPQIRPGGIADATRLLTVPNDEQATTLIPTTDALPTRASAKDDADQDKPKRSPWLWPLIVLVIVLVAVAGLTTWAFLSQSAGTTTPSSSTSSSAAPSSSAAASSSAASTAYIDATLFEGRDAAWAQNYLTSLGFQSTIETGDAAPDSTQVGEVESVSPAGNVALNRTITVTVYGEVSSVAIPNVVGYTKAEAVSALKDLGLTVVINKTKQSSDTIAAGSVISSDPVARTSVDPGSTVTLTISSGPASTSSPSPSPTDSPSPDSGS